MNTWFNIHNLDFMNPVAYLYGRALRLTKSRAEIDALLLYASKTNHPLVAQAALVAGADVHVCDDRPLRNASYAGFASTAKVLLRFYKLPDDRITLDRIRSEASRFGNPAIGGMLDQRLGLM